MSSSSFRATSCARFLRTCFRLSRFCAALRRFPRFFYRLQVGRIVSPTFPPICFPFSSRWLAPLAETGKRSARERARIGCEPDEKGNTGQEERNRRISLGIIHSCVPVSGISRCLRWEIARRRFQQRGVVASLNHASTLTKEDPDPSPSEGTSSLKSRCRKLPPGDITLDVNCLPATPDG